MKLEKKYIMHFRYLVKEIMVSLLKLLPISIRTSKMFSKLLKISSKLMQTFSEIILKLLFNRHQYLLLKLDQASMLQVQYQVKFHLKLAPIKLLKVNSATPEICIVREAHNQLYSLLKAILHLLLNQINHSI